MLRMRAPGQAVYLIQVYRLNRTVSCDGTHGMMNNAL